MPPVKPGTTVAITGATGFIGSHACAAALDAGYRVRAVVRNEKDEDKVAHLWALTGADERLSVHSGSLDKPGSYDAAFEGADAVIHTAAVVEIHAVKNPEEQIVKPSIEGVQNVLASADKAPSVRRFVHTSSVVAAMQWDNASIASITESDWNTVSTVENGDAYGYAKAKAERMVLEHQASYDAVSILPVVNLGPCMTKAHTKASASVVRQFIFGNQQVEYFANFVDVRETASALVKALCADLPEGGDLTSRRFLVVGEDSDMTISALQEPLRKLFPQYRMDANPYPSPALAVLMRAPLLWRLFTTPFRRAMIDIKPSPSNTRSKEVLGVQYRLLEDTLRDTVKSMVDTGFVKPRLAAK